MGLVSLRVWNILKPELQKRIFCRLVCNARIISDIKLVHEWALLLKRHLGFEQSDVCVQL